MSSKKEITKEETIYDRVSKLEDEIATLRNEVDVIKNAFRNELARHEVKMIKRGHDVTSIIDE
jgi:cell division protein FtsB